MTWKGKCLVPSVSLALAIASLLESVLLTQSRSMSESGRERVRGKEGKASGWSTASGAGGSWAQGTSDDGFPAQGSGGQRLAWLDSSWPRRRWRRAPELPLERRRSLPLLVSLSRRRWLPSPPAGGGSAGAEAGSGEDAAGRGGGHGGGRTAARGLHGGGGPPRRRRGGHGGRGGSARGHGGGGSLEGAWTRP